MEKALIRDTDDRYFAHSRRNVRNTQVLKKVSKLPNKKNYNTVLIQTVHLLARQNFCQPLYNDKVNVGRKKGERN